MHAISIAMWLPFTSAFLPMHSGHAAFRCGLALQKSKLLTSCKAKTHYQFKIPTYNSVIPLISFPYSQRSHVSSCYHRILSYCRAARSNRLTIGQPAVAHIMLCRDRDAKCVFRWLYSKSCWWRKQITLLAEGERREKPGRQGKCVCLRQGGQFEQCSRDRGCFALLSQCYVSIRIRGWDLPGWNVQLVSSNHSKYMTPDFNRKHCLPRKKMYVSLQRLHNRERSAVQPPCIHCRNKAEKEKLSAVSQMTYKVKNVDDTTITGHMTKWRQEKKIRSRMLFLEVSFKKKKNC